jgi:enoyl-CoA hydratase/carnithine racemase
MPSLWNIASLFSLTLLLNGSGAKSIKKSCINGDCSATRITISNPPVNLFDDNVISELNLFLESLAAENHTKVVVVSSDVSGFFGAQIDLNILGPSAPPGINGTAVLDRYYDNLDRILASPVIFIGEVDGRAWGAGDEHLLRMDMRFAGPNAQFGAPEAAVGLIHVGGLQQLTRLIGPGLASEYMLSAAQVSGKEASRIGWVNSVYPTTQALRQHVDHLATKIAKFHIEVLRATKASIAEQAPKAQMLLNDHIRFDYLASLPFAGKNVAKILDLSNNQSKAWELNNNDNVATKLY